MDNKELLYKFFNCGDNDIIEFALLKARLNRREREVISCMFDECMTQEQIAEAMNFSTRRIQDFWYSGAKKLLNIPWVKAYAISLQDTIF